jgi:amino acid adenylation domain-containing protein
MKTNNNLYIKPHLAIKPLSKINYRETFDIKDLCIHQIFEQQVEKTPEAVAVVFENRQFTYQELNCRVNQLAYHLRSLGVGPEVLVGICMERSLEMVVGLLGILKAGGAYVPLDPAYPLERLAFVLEDTQTPVILTVEGLVKKLPEHGAQVVCLDSDWEAIAQNSEENPICETTPENLIYVIYTSGSTGKPKGVMIPHLGISNMLEWRQATFEINERDKVLQTFSFCFDPSVWQIFWPLCFGAQLIMARPGGHQDSAYLVKTIAEQQITIVGFVPSIIRVLVEEKGIENCQSLRHVTSGGEALSIELAESFLNCLNLDNILLNCYGPTEASIDVTYWICQRKTEYIFSPIGQPTTNVEIYILDEDLQPVPMGEIGELHIGGLGLARGYLNRPDLTKEKFIPNPLTDFRLEDSSQNSKSSIGAQYINPKSNRLYKTGDLGRYLPDGNIEFLGRIDHQVKIRGFRIELGEIEAILSQHPGVQQSLVMAREDVPGDKRLVAYLVAHLEQIPSQDELRHFLLLELPEYMVPAAFVFMDAMPLNPNGKVDRRALPAPDSSSFIRSTSFIAPSTPKEEILAAIWEQVLGVKQIGVEDNFFELGGHSLLATQVISRVRQTLSIEVALGLLFEKPTIASFARAIAELPSNTDVSKSQPISQSVNRDSGLSFAQQRMWLLEQIDPNSAAYLVPTTQRLTGKLNIGVLQQSLDAIVARHEALRTNFLTSSDGNPIQIIGEPRSVELKIIELTGSQEEEVQRLLNHEARHPFNLTSDLMLRATLLKVEPNEHILLLVMHHIASDGWSIGILWEQLAAIYEALLNNNPPDLPKLPIQYADFAAWQNQWLSKQVIDTQLDYWKNQLKGATPLELPTDQPRPAVQNHQGAYQSLVLPKQLTVDLKALSRRSDSTLFMTLLTAFKTLLYRYTAQEDIVIGTPIAGRNQTETEDLIGCFINTLVLRTDVMGNPTFLELLSRVRKVALDAYAHQDIPFEKVVEELHPQRNLSRSPVFDVMFNFINTPQTTLEFPGLTLTPVELNEPESIFSMTLYLEEHLGDVSLQLVYQKAIFSAARMTSLLNQFQYLLEQIVATPESPISSYSLVTPKSQTLLPNPSAVLLEPEYELVTAMFTAQANRIPEHPAVSQGSSSWNYSELSKSAHQLARVLVSQGVKQGEVVAVFGQRSFGAIAGMMGVLLSGGVLLNIDPKLPVHRQQVMLQEAKAKCLLYIDSESREKPKWQSVDIITVDPDTGVSLYIDNESLQLPKLSGDDPAYIFFTSGTTGVPKGVLGCHKGMGHFLTWQRQTFKVGQKDRSAQLTGFSFDVILRDVFLPLTSGATLCLPKEGDELEPARILRWLEQEQISLIHTVPSLAQSWLVNVPADVSLRALRCVFFAGEPLKDTLIRQWRETFPQSGEIVNLYGPTETTMAKCYYRVTPDTPQKVQPIGSPLPETQALIFAENNQMCGIGEPGQIVIRTPFRSLGYINTSISDSSRFVKNPNRNDEQDLLYYTGDRGRYRPDGSLEILGRMDRQVKIRGVRIELREIETVLGEHPLVRSVVVIAREDQPGDQRLVAYIVPQQQVTINELRRFLNQKLPTYMIPSAFVMLEALPLTPNGKVDRLALPVPDQRQEVEESFVAPQNELEYQLTKIWEEVLGLQAIGVRDNFFELGGHSLLAVKLFWQIQKSFGINLPLATLFQSGTVEALASIIREEQNLADVTHQKKRSASWSSLVPIQPKGDKPPFFCIHAMGGNVLSYYELSRHLGDKQPFYGLQSQGLDGQAPNTVLEDMASHYLKEIQTVQPKGPYFLGGHSFGGLVAYEIAQQLYKQGEQVDLLVLFDTPVPGVELRLPLLQRVPIHLKKLFQQGPSYFGKKIKAWLPWLTLMLKNKLRIASGKPIEDVEALLPHDIVRLANHEARDKYIIQPYPGKLTVLGVSGDMRESDDGYPGIGYKLDPNYGWTDNLVKGGFSVQIVPGNHVSMLTEPHVQVLAEKLKLCLEQTHR